MSTAKIRVAAGSTARSRAADAPLPLAQLPASRYCIAVKKAKGREAAGVTVLKHLLGGIAVVFAVAAGVQVAAWPGSGTADPSARPVNTPRSESVSFVELSDGTRLAYERRGEGPATMVMIHGSPGDKSDFDRLVPQLRNRFTSYAFDMPGFGDSSRWVEDYGYQAAATRLGEALERLGLAEEGVVALGFSFGGGVAIELAAQFPGAVRSLVLLAAVGVPDGFHTGSYGGEFARTVAVAPVLLVYPGSMAPGLIDFSTRYGFWRGFLDSDTRRIGEVLTSINVPALIVHSRADTVVGPETATIHNELLANSRLVWYDGGHGLIYRRGETLSNAILENLDFLVQPDGVHR